MEYRFTILSRHHQNNGRLSYQVYENLARVIGIGSAAATYCSNGVTNETGISTQDFTNNPVFIETATGTVFSKYDTPIFDASEAELVALEYIGRYEQDTEDNWWVVSREGQPLSRLSKLYGDHFATMIPTLRTFDYEYSATEYLNALQTVRGNITIQDEAMAWAATAKEAYRTRTSANGGLVERYVPCGPAGYVCPDSEGCRLMGNARTCTVCAQGSCYDALLPDGC